MWIRKQSFWEMYGLVTRYRIGGQDILNTKVALCLYSLPNMISYWILDDLQYWTLVSFLHKKNVQGVAR